MSVKEERSILGRVWDMQCRLVGVTLITLWHGLLWGWRGVEPTLAKVFRPVLDVYQTIPWEYVTVTSLMQQDVVAWGFLCINAVKMARSVLFSVPSWVADQLKTWAAALDKLDDEVQILPYGVSPVQSWWIFQDKKSAVANGLQREGQGEDRVDGQGYQSDFEGQRDGQGDVPLDGQKESQEGQDGQEGQKEGREAQNEGQKKAEGEGQKKHKKKGSKHRKSDGGNED